MKTSTLGGINNFIHNQVIDNGIYKHLPAPIRNKLINEINPDSLDPEFCHNIAMWIWKHAEKSDRILNSIKDATHAEWEESLQLEIAGLQFPNQAWLAAGFCKEPMGLKFWEAFWFGSITVGWMWEYEQFWNHKPRIIREKNWVRNAVWLPWWSLKDRVQELQYRVDANMMPNVPLGANLCNSARLNEENDPDKLLQLKIQEYKNQMTAMYQYFDYFEINISCPNQAGWCSLTKDLDIILKELTAHNDYLAMKHGVTKKKLFVKISPLTQNPDNPEKMRDGTLEGLKSLADVCNQYSNDGVHWVIATNTAQEHPKMDAKDIYSPSMDAHISGGASGKQIQKTSLNTVKELRKVLDNDIAIIGVGWIGYDEPWQEGQSAINMMDAWADSLQLYTSFVNKSVLVPKYIKEAMVKEMQK